MSRPKVAVNVQIPVQSGYGGVESVIIGLVSALGKLLDGDEEYVLIGHPDNYDWLQPYTAQNQKLVRAKVYERKYNRLPKALWKMASTFRKPLQNYLHDNHTWPSVPISDGFIESLKCDVLHIPHQSYIICSLPTIYNPHDLQHRHLPQFFPPQSIAQREVVHSTACRFAHTVVAGSNWVKEDIISHHGIDSRKVQVIPWAPPTLAQEPVDETVKQELRKKYQLPEQYVYYPAMTWPHKNHLRLIEAISLLKTRKNININLVCSGQKNDFWPKIDEKIQQLGLRDKVIFLGLVPHQDLRPLYQMSEFVAVPTLFEAASGPVFEAWQENIPVMCSTVTSLPEQVQNAALLFDPYSIDAIAQALEKMTLDKPFREKLRNAGKLRLQDFSWEKTAKAYRAVYRRAARWQLTEEDHWLLGHDWMKQSERKYTEEVIV